MTPDARQSHFPLQLQIQPQLPLLPLPPQGSRKRVREETEDDRDDVPTKKQKLDDSFKMTPDARQSTFPLPLPLQFPLQLLPFQLQPLEEDLLARFCAKISRDGLSDSDFKKKSLWPLI